MNRATITILILVLAAGFFALNLVSGALVRGVRIDATEGSLFTLTQGSRNIARSPEEPVKLTLYYSAKLAQGRPAVQTYAQRVRELLEEFQRISGGKLELTIVDPEPFSEAEDQAVAAGLTGVPLGSGESLYFGLVATNALDGKETIAFFDPSKERFLEYDIAKLIHSLSNATRPIIGLITSLPIEGAFAMDPRTGQPTQTPAWAIITELREVYEVRSLTNPTSIPPDIKTLVLVHPRDLTPATLYAIDQFVLRGGGLIALVDPACEAQQGPPQQMPGTPPPDRASSLGPLLAAWGVEIPVGELVGDAELGLRVSTPDDPRGEPVPYVLWMVARRDQFNREDPVMADLEGINLASVGHIAALLSGPATPTTPEGEATTAAAPPRATITPLIQTTKSAGIMGIDTLTPPIQPKQILRRFTPGTTPLTLAARLSGTVNTAFPDGPPAAEPNSQDEKAPDAASQLKTSTGSINVVLVADADMLQDMFWTRTETMFGQRMQRRIADNADFLLTAIDNLAGGVDLTSVRARREIARPFTLVQDMEKRAEREFLTQQQILEERLTQTQARIDELQAKRGGDGTGTDAFALTPEQQAEVDRFRKEFLDTRKQLREVRLNLRRDTETLGTQLKLINIALMPALVCAAAIFLWTIRSLRRKAARARA